MTIDNKINLKVTSLQLTLSVTSETLNQSHIHATTKTTRESAVSSGRWKNMAMSGAQKKRTAYIVRLARMLNQNTEL